MKRAILVASLLVCACAPFVQFSQMGPDTFAVETGQSFAGRAEAGRYCAQLGKKVLITSTQQRFDGATVIFRCLAANDPEYRRPDYQRAPDAVIQDNRSR